MPSSNALPQANLSPLSLQAQAKLKLRQRQRTGTLYDFVPSTVKAYSAPRHLDPLVQHLERSWTERVRAAAHAPPRHSKTETVLLFLAQTLQRFPHKSLGYITYEANLARSKSRKVRAWAEQSGVVLQDGARRMDEWVTREGGGLIAGGIGGPLTGRGLDCFPAGTPIQTEIGPVDIQTLHRLHDRPRVLSFNHISRSAVWCRIEATREIESDDLVEVVTAAGRVVRCTADHRFYVEGSGYREAALLRGGDRLVIGQVTQQQDVCSVWRPEDHAHGDVQSLLRGVQEDGPNPYLRLVQGRVSTPLVPDREGQAPWSGSQLLLCQVQQGPSRGQECASLCPLQESDAGEHGAQVLWTGLQEGCPAAEVDDQLWAVPRTVHPGQSSDAVLRQAVCEQGSRRQDGRGRQSPLLDGYQLRQIVSGDAPADPGAGWVCLPGLQGAGAGVRDILAGSVREPVEHGHPSHRREPGEQQAGKPGDAVHDVPCGTPQVGLDAVAMVRRVRSESVAVYDLQVEGQHNFFAGDVLVHNCLVIDDPYKNRAQAESAAYQRMVVDWWGDVANTRIEPGGSIFVFHTRWTTNDLIGHILSGEDAAEWSWLCMPAIADDPLPGRETGSALWPERWPTSELLAKKAAVGPYTWASLYQGRPQPRGGAVFSAAPAYYDTLHEGYRVAIGVDLAYTRKTKADHSVAVVLAEKAGVYYLLDVVRARGLSAPQFTERLKALRARHPGAPFLWIASGTEIGAADFVTQAGIPLTVENASTDKFVRAIDVAADWNGGRILVPSDPRPWVPPLLDEVSAFTGQNDPEDDQIDALAAAHKAFKQAIARPSDDKYRDLLRRRI